MGLQPICLRNSALAPGDHIDVSGLHCHCGLTSAGSGEAVFVVYAIARNHMEAHDL